MSELVTLCLFPRDDDPAGVEMDVVGTSSAPPAEADKDFLAALLAAPLVPVGNISALYRSNKQPVEDRQGKGAGSGDGDVAAGYVFPATDGYSKRKTRLETLAAGQVYDEKHAVFKSCLAEQTGRCGISDTVPSSPGQTATTGAAVGGVGAATEMKLFPGAHPPSSESRGAAGDGLSVSVPLLSRVLDAAAATVESRHGSQLALYQMTAHAALVPVRYIKGGAEQPYEYKHSEALSRCIGDALHVLDEDARATAQAIPLNNDIKRQMLCWKRELLRQLHSLNSSFAADAAGPYGRAAFASAGDFGHWLKAQTTLLHQRLLDISSRISNLGDIVGSGGDLKMGEGNMIPPARGAALTRLLACCMCAEQVVAEPQGNTEQQQLESEQNRIKKQLKNLRSTFGEDDDRDVVGSAVPRSPVPSVHGGAAGGAMSEYDAPTLVAARGLCNSRVARTAAQVPRIQIISL